MRVGVSEHHDKRVVKLCSLGLSVLARGRVLFQCDNTGVVAAITKGSSKDEMVMTVVVTLVRAVHIAGALNGTADQLSIFFVLIRRLQFSQFHCRRSF